ncbi:MAG: hypothetical protein NTX18_03520 [Cyanobium sp. LacPavin_0818_WC50_MAG_67_9]|nr:hypothetical protein [Cyanobium sp. LacPavin_0818_WC50_MAG_67_9]
MTDALGTRAVLAVLVLATYWHTLHHLGLHTPIAGCGRLMALKAHPAMPTP